MPVMLVRGDDAVAKDITAGLVREPGFDAVDAGDLTPARLIEAFAMLWKRLALRRGFGTNWAFVLWGRSVHT